jgi:signal peptidase II
MYRRRRELFLTFLILLLTVLSDQIVKAVVRHQLEPGTIHRVIGSILLLVRAENSGAFLSLGSDWPSEIRISIFILLSAGILIGVIIFTLSSRRLTLGVTIGLALIAGGGLGNLADRIFRGGQVTDFINVGIGGLRTGIFNLADLFITGGVIVLAVSFIRNRGHVNPWEQRTDGDRPTGS